MTLGELHAKIRRLQVSHGRGILAAELVARGHDGLTGHVLGIHPSIDGDSIAVELETDIDGEGAVVYGEGACSEHQRQESTAGQVDDGESQL